MIVNVFRLTRANDVFIEIVPWFSNDLSKGEQLGAYQAAEQGQLVPSWGRWPRTGRRG
jgi:hypothetical protein